MKFIGCVSLLLTVSSGFWFTAQPPAADECQALNASEPAECPEHIGPPCPPCIINDSPDYKPGDNGTISPESQSTISKLINSYVEFWLSNYPPNMTDPNDDLSAATFIDGSSGRSQMFLRLYYYTKNSTYLKIAKEYFNHAISIIPESQTYANYFTGHIGVWTLGAVINDLSFKHENVNNNNKLKYDVNTDEYITLIQSTLSDVNEGIISNSKYSPKYKIDIQSGTLIVGLSGALYTGMLVNEYFDNKTLIDPTYISNIAYYLIDLGLAVAQEFGKNYIAYPSPFTPGCYMPGAAEGSAGTINQILNAYILGYTPDLFSNIKYYNAIKNTLNYYTSIQLPDGNIGTPNTILCDVDYGNDSDSRVQWCHGAPGFIDPISKAVYIWSTLIDGITTNTTLLSIAESYLTTVLGTYNSTWQRGLLIKGLMQCHGIGGNSYTLLHLYDNLKNLINNVDKNGNSKTWNGIGKYSYDDLEYLREQAAWRGSQLIQWTLMSENTDALRTKYSDEDFSAWLGSYGVPFIWIQAMQNGWPYSEPVCMPAWNFCVP